MSITLVKARSKKQQRDDSIREDVNMFMDSEPAVQRNILLLLLKNQTQGQLDLYKDLMRKTTDV